MSSVSERVSSKIANMSFLCAVLVVCIHVQRPGGCSFFLIKWISGGVSQIAVPFFFAVSGYLLLNHLGSKGWWFSSLKKRLKTLVVPFFCLNLFWFPIIYSFHAIGVRYFHADDTNRIMDLTFCNFMKGINILPFWGGPILGVLWYVRALLLLVLVAPIFVWVIGKSKRVGGITVVSLFSLWVFQANVFPWMSYELSLRCLFYFALGMFVRMYELENVKKWVGGVLLCSGISALIASKNISGLGVFGPVLSSSYVILLMVGFWSLMPTFVLPSFFKGTSFAIYVIHPMLIYLGGTIFKATGLWAFANTDMGILFSVIVYTVMACGIKWCMDRKLQSVSALFFGGR